MDQGFRKEGGGDTLNCQVLTGADTGFRKGGGDPGNC